MRRYAFLLSLIILLPAVSAHAGGRSFIDSINRATDGSWFNQAIMLNNKCDFSKCRTSDCARRVFSYTIFAQECEYVSGSYGVRGKDWDVSGQSSVDVYNYSEQRYYDDLGIEIFGTGENKVLHFEITSSVDALNSLAYI